MKELSNFIIRSLVHDVGRSIISEIERINKHFMVYVIAIIKVQFLIRIEEEVVNRENTLTVYLTRMMMPICIYLL